MGFQGQEFWSSAVPLSKAPRCFWSSRKYSFNESCSMKVHLKMQWICAWTFLTTSYDGSISRIIYNESTGVKRPDFIKSKINEHLNCLTWLVRNKTTSSRLQDRLKAYQLQMLFRGELYMATRMIQYKLWEVYLKDLWTAVAQWLRCCVTNRKVAGTIPASFRSHYIPGVDSASNRNEYQEYFLGVKAAVT